MRMLIIDFETRSPVDIRAHGSDYYAADPNTSVLCMCALELINNEPGRTWAWTRDDKVLPDDLLDAIEDADYIAAHNAAFDQAIWVFAAMPDHDFPEIPLEKWYCTSAQCRVNALPGGLDAAARAIDATQKKDPYGNSLIKKVCCPNINGDYDDDPLLLQQLLEYCEQDVRATAAIVQQTRPMMKFEHRDYVVNERINHRGVRIDRELASFACYYADAEKEEIGVIISDITFGQINKHTQGQRIIKWIREQFLDDHEIVQAMVKRVNGEKKYSLDNAARDRVMACEDNEFTTDVLDVVDLVDQGNKSSVAKFRSMLNMADPISDRVYGAFVYAGAGQTLRFSSRGLQLHNFRRKCFSSTETERLKSLMREEKTLVGEDGRELSVMDTLSSLLRPAIIPDDGKLFVLCDWSAIEARVLPWLADSDQADEYLDIFDSSRCVYTETANALGFDDRQLGKVMVLALGFGGGAGAFAAMAKVYDVRLSDQEVADVIKRWREKHDWAVKFWNDLEFSALAAIRHPGQTFEAGRVSYTFAEKLLEGTLICKLPGGHYIQYPKARIENLPTPWGGERPTITCLKASITAKRDDKEWPRAKMWRGALAENVTQAFAGVLLRESLAVLDTSIALEVVAHTHDEIVCEALQDDVNMAADTLRAAMLTPPSYADDLPLDGEVKIMQRYGK